MNQSVTVGYVDTVSPIWRYEIRRCGCGTLALPPAGAAVLAGAAAVLDVHSVVRSAAVAIVPLLAGLGAAAALGRDRLIELQSTVPTSYRLTVVRRLVLVLCSTFGAVLSIALLAAEPSAASVLDVSACALALVGLAFYISAGAGSTAAASSMITTAWLAKLLVLEQLSQNTVVQVMPTLALATVCVYLGAVRLGEAELPLRAARP